MRICAWFHAFIINLDTSSLYGFSQESYLSSLYVRYTLIQSPLQRWRMLGIRPNKGQVKKDEAKTGSWISYKLFNGHPRRDCLFAITAIIHLAVTRGICLRELTKRTWRIWQEKVEGVNRRIFIRNSAGASHLCTLRKWAILQRWSFGQVKSFSMYAHLSPLSGYIGWERAV